MKVLTLVFYLPLLAFEINAPDPAAMPEPIMSVDDIKMEPGEPKQQWETYEATAYTAFCNTGCIGITRTGVDVSNTIYFEGKRVVAVDPNYIPLGATLEIKVDDEIILATAQDTGGAIIGKRIDIIHRTKEEAWKFGRRDVKVRIIK